MKKRISLEKEAEAVCISSAKPPLIYQMPPQQGRIRLNEAQNSPVYMYPATIKDTIFKKDVVFDEKWGDFKIYLVSPNHFKKINNIILYIHGAGWVFGNFHTHEKLVRELCVRTNSYVIFPEYSLSPEVKYPTAIEQCYSLLNSLPEILPFDIKYALDRLIIAGDSVGGNMTAVMTLLSKFRNGAKIYKQLLFYPVTNANFDTQSYMEFATGYYLTRAGMMWFWDQYTKSQTDRNQITASPLRASIEQLSGLPQAMIITDEADVLRDEGEAYGDKLRSAGVDVTAIRVKAITHDFVMLNALDQTKACRIAMDAAVEWINRDVT